MEKISAYVTEKAKSELKPYTYDGKVGDNDVLIKVSHCGVCQSDIHLVDGDWGDVYPCIAGHEIIGTVDRTGEKVKTVKIGDKVGVGWQCNSCNNCEYCENEEETFCKENQPTCVEHFGGFAQKVISNERFVIPIPETMDSAKTAPLLCAGITVYTPLKRYVKKGDKVAIIGIGGLGHLAIQFAKKMGCSVTAISRSKDKELESKEFGADNFITSEPKPDSFDLIINTTHISPDMNIYMASIKPKGTFVQVGISETSLDVDPGLLIGGNKSVAGSGIGSPKMIKEMIKFAQKHNVYAKVEVLPMSNINEALNKTRMNEARYRIVLENK